MLQMSCSKRIFLIEYACNITDIIQGWLLLLTCWSKLSDRIVEWKFCDIFPLLNAGCLYHPHPLSSVMTYHQAKFIQDVLHKNLKHTFFCEEKSLKVPRATNGYFSPGREMLNGQNDIWWQFYHDVHNRHWWKFYQNILSYLFLFNSNIFCWRVCFVVSFTAKFEWPSINSGACLYMVCPKLTSQIHGLQTCRQGQTNRDSAISL